MATTRRALLSQMGLLAALAPAVAARAASPGPRPVEEKVWIDALGAAPINPVGLAALSACGLSMFSTTVGTAIGPAEAPTFTYDAAVRDIATWREAFARHPDRLLQVTRADDVLAAHRTGRVGVMLNFQNATHLNRDLRNLEVFHGLGVRQIQLTYNEQNEIGAGCIEPHDAGLSAFGHAVVARMNELGIAVDLSHCGDQTTLDAMAASKRPVLFTHTNCRALRDNPRCKTDEAIRRCAGTGGVIGMTTYGTYISGSLPVTLDDLMRHIDHAVQLAGVEHVGIGSDTPVQHFDGPQTQADYEKMQRRQSNFRAVVGAQFGDQIEELNGPEKFFRIEAALRRRGYSAADTDKILGANFLRAYREIIG